MKKFIDICRKSLGWFLGIIFMISGVCGFFESTVSSVCLVLISIILLPPLSLKIENKIKTFPKIKKYWLLKAIAIIVFFIFYILGDIPEIANKTIPYLIIAILTIIVVLIYCNNVQLKIQNSDLTAKNNELLSENVKYKPIKDIEAETKNKQDEQNEIIKEIATLKEDYNTKLAYYNSLKEALMLAEEENDILEFGVYKPHFNFDISAKYKIALEQNYDKQKAFAQENYNFYLKYSPNETFKKDRLKSIKFAYRAFNSECDAIITKVDWKNANQMEQRIRKSFETINKLASNSIFITELNEKYLELKLKELYLTHEYAVKKQEEKEEQRRIQEQIREEQKVIKEFEEAKLQAEKEEKIYQKALLQAQKDLEKASENERNVFETKIAELQEQLKEAENKKERAISQAQLTKCGYIYVISNIGSFGENVYKIGMTRRLEPMDRINELGDASVPFKFDVHALIFSENAPELENKLHNHFKERAVNLVNLKKEFFNVSLDEIEKVVHENYAEIEFTKIAEAKDYRESLAIRQSKETINAEYKKENCDFPTII